MAKLPTLIRFRLIEQGRRELEANGIDAIDYLEIADCCTLASLDRIEYDAQALIAAFVGPVRLIDNLRLAI